MRSRTAGARCTVAEKDRGASAEKDTRERYGEGREELGVVWIIGSVGGGEVCCAVCMSADMCAGDDGYIYVEKWILRADSGLEGKCVIWW